MSYAPDPQHASLTERSFTQQAPAFEDKRFNQVLTTESEWLYRSLPLTASDLLLDVAAGTGLAGRSLARGVRAVIALDATPEMLEVGRRVAIDEALTNVVFQRGDAAALPFLNESFEVVVCRYALHHFPEPEIQITEMVRVLRPGGHLALADLLADENPNAATVQNHLERLRDPSHAHALPAAKLRTALERHGLTVVATETRAVRRPLAPWMEQTQTPTAAVEKIESALTGELDRHGAPTGFQPQRDEEGRLTIVQTLASLVARKSV
jgi:ubiquinone/menaquinone biosynthesis C-methylase UbiE